MRRIIIHHKPSPAMIVPAPDLATRRRRAVTAAWLLLAAAGLAGPVGATAAGPELIVNGSFETPDVATGGFATFPSIPGWLHAAREGVTSSGIEIKDRQAGDPAPGAGDQWVELDSDGPSRISQEIPTSPRSTYRLKFIYAARRNTPAADNHFLVSAGSQTAQIGPLTSDPTQTQWQSYTLDFVATAATSRIEYVDLGPEQARGGFGAYIDFVRVRLINSPPDCSGVGPSTRSLWPPNHKLRAVVLGGASDPDGDPVAIAITGVTQDEPLDGLADGSGFPDAAAAESADQVRLRAERSGAGDGRVYRLAYLASDPSGATCSGTTIVSVPRNGRAAPAVDSRVSYDSFGS